MNLLHRLLLCTLLAAIAGCATRPTAAPAAANAATSPPAPLLLVSIDGYRADYLQRGLSPTLQALADGGVRAESMQPSFPSLTFPNHYTIVTGLRPDHHGIVNNTMFDERLGKFSLGNRKAVSDGRWWAEGTPLWETASQHGLHTATMFWPGSEADIHGRHPDHWRPFDGKVTPDQRVDQVLAWLDLPVAQRPAFLTLYFDAVDHAGHAYGPDTPQVDAALRETDAALARLLRGLEQRGLADRINLIVLADHGMAPVPLDHSVLIDKLIPLDQVRTVSLGVLAGFNPKPGHDFAAVEAAMEKPQQHMQCWDKTRVPARLAYGSNPRVPQLLCLADAGWRITTGDYLAQKAKQGKTPSLGEHGYDNADPHMQALFVAHGPAFRQGLVVKPFPNVDVYPLMAHLLGLPPAANDGDYDAVSGMLKPAQR
ncbi:phosphodiesterase [Frateuria sp. Soil773]|uniref:alkaline phosphatase family protein n=1 Tax=Frateuria sp. Soil773 TaxID=1736407 RepID=UPI0006FE8837|nr:ectonucleotide pyrophosphatase/phosphodiesterase [Frateuria sp. Soil773]KRE96782.1 phosphodiesterase [Frateuria sp. Soil773]